MLTWHLIPKTPDYISGCGQFVAEYQRTIKGYGCFAVFKVNTLRKKPKDAVAVGGLPQSYRSLGV